MKNTTITEHPFRSVRRAGVPLVAFETPDPSATITGCQLALNGKGEETTICTWNIVQGMNGVNKLGQAFAQEVSPDGPIQTGNPSECLDLVNRKCPDNFILFFWNAHRFVENESVAQAIWNLRDTFKAKQCALVLLAPSIRLPAELRRDVVILTEELPSEAELSTITDSIVRDAKLPELTDKERPAILDTLLGLSPFEAEQTLALSINKKGIDIPSLWDRKVKAIEQTPGLTVWRGKETFADIGGLDNLKKFLTQILTSGRTHVRSILYLDELEKSLSGATDGGSDGGTSKDQLAVLLTMMQDRDLPGILLLGPAGTGKSTIAKAAGSVAKIPVVACDLGAMKGSLVGQSEERIRTAMNVFQAISQGKAIVIATCNNLVSLPPELKRRFSLGTFYIDLPSDSERESIWPFWIKRYSLEAQPIPACSGWTGAEIKACCDVAYRAGLSLVEAARYIVPVCKSAGDQIDRLRKMASGKFISASVPGYYNSEVTATQPTGRKLGN